MTTRRHFAASLLGVALAAGFGATATAQPMPPRPPGWRPPPPRIRETIPPRPSGNVIWAPGHWNWSRNRYSWVGGRYVSRRRGWNRWNDGRWVVRNGRWVWAPGFWS
jgi:hypothetical protein